MALKFLYRLNGGQVLSASTDQTYSEHDMTRYGVAADPATPDGTDLAIPKIAVSGGTIVRNATAGEQTAFAAAAATEVTQDQRNSAKALLDAVQAQGKLVRAVVECFVQEINAVRILPLIGLGVRTAAQVKTCIRDKIDSGAVDG